MKHYERHIRNERHFNGTGETVSFCGEPLTEFDLGFLNVDHAVNTIISGGFLLPCPKCRDKVVQILIEAN